MMNQNVNSFKKWVMPLSLWALVSVAGFAETFFLKTLFASSPKYVKTYAGPPQPRENVALLARMEKYVMIESIDGRTIDCQTNFGTGSLELLPGTHEMGLSYRPTGVPLGFQTIRFQTEAGRVYALYANQKGSVWNPSVVDITSSTDKKERKIAASMEEHFLEYRNTTAPHLEMPPGTAALMNMGGMILFSIDDVPTSKDFKFSLYFRFSEGRHLIVTGPVVANKDTPVMRIGFTAAAGHVYSVLRNAAGGVGPYAPCVIDVTGEMDNVKENLVEPINKFLRK